MQKWLIIAMALVAGLNANVFAQDSYEERVQEYIKTYRDLAVKEQIRSGIPAAITLAQGIHETSAGSSRLATDANNHFGIKCKKNWTGLTYSYTDDAPDECFRKYTQPEESYKDHSDYLAANPRYASCFKCSATDYRGWAMGLKKCGYATNPKYAQLLIKIIEDYNLQEYTYAALTTSKKKGNIIVKEIVPEHDAPTVKKDVLDASVTPPSYGVPLKVNGLRAVYAKKGDMPLEYAIKHNVRYERLLEYNEIDERPLPADMFLYLERKGTKGAGATYKVKDGETLRMIAQTQGIQLKSLRALNMLREGEEPGAGAVLSLQKQLTRKPKTASNVADAVPDTPDVVAAAPETMAQETVETIAVTADAPHEIITASTEMLPEPTPVKYDYGETSEPPTDSDAKMALRPTNAGIALPGEEHFSQDPAEDRPVKTDNTDMLVVTNVTTADIKTVVPAETEPTTTQSQQQTETGNGDTKEVAATVSEIKTANLPAPDNTFISKAAIEEQAHSEIGPPVSIAEIPEKKADKPQVAAAEKVTEQAPPDRPKSELDILKSKFDKVVYAAPKPIAAPAEPQTEVPQVAEAPAVQEEPGVKQIVIPGTAKFYVVKKGDTAFSIARAHGLTVSQLQELNGLDFDAIKVGQRLRIKQ